MSGPSSRGSAMRCRPHRRVSTGSGDAAAVLDDGLLLKTDILVEGIHFDLSWCDPEDVGWKALAVNLSDIAAMGGAPTAAVVALVVPPDRPGMADRTMIGLVSAAERLGCPIVGGDTSSGPALTVAVAVLGQAPEAGPVPRSGAQPGDIILVTGELGAAASALAGVRQGKAAPVGLQRLRRPKPRLAEGAAAAQLDATAMIDLSDGLATDLGHVCEESKLEAVTDEGKLPPFPGADLQTVLYGGDDYELLFTVPPHRCDELPSWRWTPITRIGVMTNGPLQVTLRGARGSRQVENRGFEHTIAAPAASSGETH